MQVKVFNKEKELEKVFYDDNNLYLYDNPILDIVFLPQGRFAIRVLLDEKLLKFWTSSKGDVLMHHIDFETDKRYSREDKRIGKLLVHQLEATHKPILYSREGDPYIKLDCHVSDHISKIVGGYRQKIKSK